MNVELVASCWFPLFTLGFIVIHKNHNNVKHEEVMEFVLKQMIRNDYKIPSDIEWKKETCFIKDAVSCYVDR